jgi:hypothetical protein
MEKTSELRTWIVFDSDGERHEVTAHYIAQGTDNGYTSFVHRDEPNLGFTHTFYHPRSVVMKKPQKLSGPPENYPVTISRPPAEINGHRVLAWAETKRRDGHYPGGTVIVFLPKAPYDHYVVWDAYTKDGGESWLASDGGYYVTTEAAWKGFTDRNSTRRAER